MQGVNSASVSIDSGLDQYDNDPTLCCLCGKTSQWPKCMQDIKMRGYHPIGDSFDITKCDNYSPKEPSDRDR